ncbi:MAG: efflux RND transporter periplasmic adaptor subunit [Pseudomonadota bacterium]
MKIPANYLKIIIPWGLIGCIAILLIYIVFFAQKATKPSNLTERTWRVEALRVTNGAYAPQVVLYGKVESPQTSTLESTIKADVNVVNVKEGQFVKQGELLIQLDDREAAINLTQQKAEVTDLESQIKSEYNRYNFDKQSYDHEKALVKLQKREMERFAYLVKQQAGSESALDQAEQKLRELNLKVSGRELMLEDHKHRLTMLKAKLAKAKATLDQAKLDMQRTKIFAPFNGRVMRVNVSVGDRMQPGEPLVEIFDINDIEIRAPIPTTYLTEVKRALLSKTVLAAYTLVDDKKVSLQLRRIAGMVEKGQGGVDGLFDILDDRKYYLSIGRIVEVYLELPKEKDIIAIPPQSIYDSNRVYKIINNRLQAVNVKQIGQLTNGDNSQYILIKTKQLKPGDIILATSLPNARSGLKVDISQTTSLK